MRLDLSITGGNLKGTNFYSPDSPKTHPMSSRVKQAIFNMLGDISNLRVLDLFAGSGAIGFESISRGAGSAVLVDNDYKAVSAARESTIKLGLSAKVHLVDRSFEEYINQDDNLFDLVFVDPPYDHLPQNLNLVEDKVSSGGLLILSLPNSNKTGQDFDFKSLRMVKQKQYGKVLIQIYKK